MGDILK